MRHMRIVIGALVGNFVVWALITLLDVHFLITFGLVMLSSVVMLLVIARFGEPNVGTRVERVSLNAENSVVEEPKGQLVGSEP